MINIMFWHFLNIKLCPELIKLCWQLFKAGSQFKSSAQGLITLATYGLGMLVGFRVAGKITDLYSIGSLHDWTQIWLIPSGFAFIVLIFFILTFKDEKIKLENE